MKKSTLLLLLLLIIAGATAWYLTGKESENTKNTLAADRQFKVENEENIHKIFIALRTGQTTTLERKGDQWIYNGEYVARPTAVKNIMEIFTTVQLQSIPNAAATEVMIESLAARGIKVELYGKDNKKLKAYYIGGVTPDERGTVMIMENAEQPYVMELPMLEGSFRLRLELLGDQWRDKTVFSYEPEDLDYVKIDYPKQRSKAFELTRTDDGFQVEKLYNTTNTPPQKVARGTAEAFLLGFERQIAEAYQNDNPKREEVLSTIPFAIITTRDTDGKETTVTLYPRGSIDALGNVKTSEVERFDTQVEREGNMDFMLTQMINYRKVLWGYDSLLEG